MRSPMDTASSLCVKQLGEGLNGKAVAKEEIKQIIHGGYHYL